MLHVRNHAAVTSLAQWIAHFRRIWRTVVSFRRRAAATARAASQLSPTMKRMFCERLGAPPQSANWRRQWGCYDLSGHCAFGLGDKIIRRPRATDPKIIE